MKAIYLFIFFHSLGFATDFHFEDDIYQLVHGFPENSIMVRLDNDQIFHYDGQWHQIRYPDRWSVNKIALSGNGAMVITRDSVFIYEREWRDVSGDILPLTDVKSIETIHAIENGWAFVTEASLLMWQSNSIRRLSLPVEGDEIMALGAFNEQPWFHTDDRLFLWHNGRWQIVRQFTDDLERVIASSSGFFWQDDNDVGGFFAPGDSSYVFPGEGRLLSAFDDEHVVWQQAVTYKLFSGSGKQAELTDKKPLQALFISHKNLVGMVADGKITFAGISALEPLLVQKYLGIMRQALAEKNFLRYKRFASYLLGKESVNAALNSEILKQLFLIQFWDGHYQSARTLWQKMEKPEISLAPYRRALQISDAATTPVSAPECGEYHGYNVKTEPLSTDKNQLAAQIAALRNAPLVIPDSLCLRNFAMFFANAVQYHQWLNSFALRRETYPIAAQDYWLRDNTLFLQYEPTSLLYLNLLENAQWQKTAITGNLLAAFVSGKKKPFYLSETAAEILLSDADKISLRFERATNTCFPFANDTYRWARLKGRFLSVYSGSKREITYKLPPSVKRILQAEQRQIIRLQNDGLLVYNQNQAAGRAGRKGEWRLLKIRDVTAFNDGKNIISIGDSLSIVPNLQSGIMERQKHTYRINNWQGFNVSLNNDGLLLNKDSSKFAIPFTKLNLPQASYKLHMIDSQTLVFLNANGIYRLELNQTFSDWLEISKNFLNPLYQNSASEKSEAIENRFSQRVIAGDISGSLAFLNTQQVTDPDLLRRIPKALYGALLLKLARQNNVDAMMYYLRFMRVSGLFAKIDYALPLSSVIVFSNGTEMGNQKYLSFLLQERMDGAVEEHYLLYKNDP
jgi:hypothetical protein